MEFKRQHPTVAAGMTNRKHPNECPMLLRTYAPWNMVRGKEASCLCINCEGTNAVKRGSKAVLNLIQTIAPSIESEDNIDKDNDDWMQLIEDDNIANVTSINNVN